MYTQITQSDFIDSFMAIRPDNFSYDGLIALYDWFEDYEADTGESIELDVIAICCDFSEMSWSDVRQEYSNMLDSDMSDDVLLDWLSDETIVIYSGDDKVLFQSF